MRQRLARFFEHHEPVHRREVQCFAVVGVALALMVVLLATAIRWSESRHAAHVLRSTFAATALSDQGQV